MTPLDLSALPMPGVHNALLVSPSADVVAGPRQPGRVV